MWLDTENPRPELYARGIPTIVFFLFCYLPDYKVQETRLTSK